MVDRLTIEEFFDAMRAQNVYPLIDTPSARKLVQAAVRAFGAHYPIKDRWPVLDLESAYEGHVNAHENLIEFHRNGYNGTITLCGFDDTYTMDEWFDDFRIQWHLNDTTVVRQRMLALLPPGPRWRSPTLYEAHQKAATQKLRGFVRRILKGK